MCEQDCPICRKYPSDETHAVREWLDECERRIAMRLVADDFPTCSYPSTGGEALWASRPEG